MEHLKSVSSRPHRERGIALLISVLMAGVLLSLGLAIFSITVKETNLAIEASQSVYAFYSADTALECALYHDQHGSAAFTGSGGTIDCNGQSIAVSYVGDRTLTTITGDEYPARVYSFSIGGTTGGNVAPSGSDGPYCADIVEVWKTYQASDPQLSAILAYGENTCRQTGPLRVQRALKASY